MEPKKAKTSAYTPSKQMNTSGILNFLTPRQQHNLLRALEGSDAPTTPLRRHLTQIGRDLPQRRDRARGIRFLLHHFFHGNAAFIQALNAEGAQQNKYRSRLGNQAPYNTILSTKENQEGQIIKRFHLRFRTLRWGELKGGHRGEAWLDINVSIRDGSGKAIIEIEDLCERGYDHDGGPVGNNTQLRGDMRGGITRRRFIVSDWNIALRLLDTVLASPVLTALIPEDYVVNTTRLLGAFRTHTAPFPEDFIRLRPAAEPTPQQREAHDLLLAYFMGVVAADFGILRL